MYLIERRDRVVTRDELLENLWSGKVVTDAAVSARLKAARKAVGDSGRTQNVIKTVHGRGYQFIAQVVEADPVEPAREDRESTPGESLFGDFSSNKPSVLVVPLVDRSDDPETAYLADAITDEVRLGLSRYRQIIVFCRESSVEPESLDAAAANIGVAVDYVLRGSVRRVGEGVRISAQLVSHATGEHIWGAKYDRELLQEVSAVYDDLALEMLTPLVGSIEMDSRGRAMRKAPASATAYDFYLRGNYYFRDWDGQRENMELAAENYSRAIELDPEFAAAYSGLAAVHIKFVDQRWAEDPERICAIAMELARKAIALDPNDSNAHVVLGACYFYGRSDPEMAQTQFRVALDLNPNHATAYCFRGWVSICTGQSDDGRRFAAEAIRRDPLLSDDCLLSFGFAEYLAGRYQQAIEVFARMANPPPAVEACIAACYAYLGNRDAASRAASEFRKSGFDPGRGESDWADYWRSVFHLIAGRSLDHLIDGVRKAGLVD